MPNGNAGRFPRFGEGPLAPIDLSVPALADAARADGVVSTRRSAKALLRLFLAGREEKNGLNGITFTQTPI